MPAPETSDDEFMDVWRRTGGSASAVSKLLGVTERNAHARRRRIEERTGEPLISTHEHSPDHKAYPAPEFPDWQELEVKNGLLVAFSDSHLIPHRKSTAHKALIKMIDELQPEACVEMGDLMDFASISRHHRIGWDKQLSVREEVEWAASCMEEISDHLPRKAKSRRRRTRGNHDQRFSGHISNNLSSYEGLKGFSLDDHILDWPVSWAIKVNGTELFISHRWKGGLHGPFNNALWTGTSHATGHQHKQQIYPLTDLKGDRWGVDVGCLSAIYSPHFRFMEGRPRNYRSGFAVFRFVNYQLRHPMLLRVVDEQKGVVEYNGRDVQV